MQTGGSASSWKTPGVVEEVPTLLSSCGWGEGHGEEEGPAEPEGPAGTGLASLSPRSAGLAQRREQGPGSLQAPERAPARGERPALRSSWALLVLWSGGRGPQGRLGTGAISVTVCRSGL